jgi:hypothetical protein
VVYGMLLDAGAAKPARLIRFHKTRGCVLKAVPVE